MDPAPEVVQIYIVTAPSNGLSRGMGTRQE
jgi:hypothetical protein